MSSTGFNGSTVYIAHYFPYVTYNAYDQQVITGGSAGVTVYYENITVSNNQISSYFVINTGWTAAQFNGPVIAEQSGAPPIATVWLASTDISGLDQSRITF